MAIPGDDTFIEEELEEAAPDEYGEKEDEGDSAENEPSDAEDASADATTEDA